MKKLMLSAGLVVMAAPAMAHPGHEFGALAGALHPLTGVDHLLAMLAVGLWSGFVMPNRVWAGAATFLAAMSAGAVLAWAGLVVGVEPMILASVTLFGLLVALSRRGQSGAVTGASLAMIAVFAACHGYAHAAESVSAAPAYLAGFLGMTAALHGFGILLARRLPQGLTGAAIAAMGLMMMVA